MKSLPPLPIPEADDSKASIRLTITVTPEVHAAFSRLAKASGMSLGRAMGEWLGDTLDAVVYTADTVERARAAPRLVAQELHAYALGIADETGSMLQKMRDQGRADRVAAATGRPAAGLPPSGNTGGKGHESSTRKPRGRA